MSDTDDGEDIEKYEGAEPVNPDHEGTDYGTLIPPPTVNPNEDEDAGTQSGPPTPPPDDETQPEPEDVLADEATLRALPYKTLVRVARSLGITSPINTKNLAVLAILSSTKNDDIAKSEAGQAISNAPRVIHFIDDGLTALGAMWYKGQELEVTDEIIERSKDRDGNSWLNMTDDEQRTRWGRIRFASGPWPHTGYEDEDAAVAEAKRRRKPPPLVPLARG